MAGSNWKEYELSSGVTVLYGPFPHGLYWDIMSALLEEFPDPEIPKKTIQVVTGTEEIDDEENPEYQQALTEARLARWEKLRRASLDMCVEPKGGLEQYEETIARVGALYAREPAPAEPADRKVWFLMKYAFRTPEDWKLIGKIQRFSQIDDEEVRRRAEFFRRDLAGAEDPGADAPGPAEE
jgi:hypothetical protein